MAIVTLPKKICSHCGGTRWQTRGNTNQNAYTCAKLESEKVLEWRSKNTDRYKKYTKQFYKDNAEYIKSTQAMWRNNNKEHISEYHRKFNASAEGKAYRKKINDKHSTELSDCYVRCTLRNIVKEDVQPTKEQIDKYRTFLKTKREYEQLT